jgi:hypothetical protein
MEKCDQCEKEFDSAQALQDHKIAKHGLKPKKSVKKYMIPAIIAVIVIAAAGSAYYFMSAPPAASSSDDFAKCISQSGAVFYGTFWCPHCQDQKKLFGSSLQFVNYVECSTPDGQSQTAECQTAGITAYPTWVFADGTHVSGMLSLSSLATRTNCII